MKKFEYKIHALDFEIKNFVNSGVVTRRSALRDITLFEEMQQLGQEGWELVGVSESQDTSSTQCFFKRELID